MSRTVPPASTSVRARDSASTSAPANQLEPEDGLFEESQSDLLVSSEELDSGDISDVEAPLHVQDMIDDDADEFEETWGVDEGAVNFEISWQTPVHYLRPH
ncbi:hypothetical protein K438DRAFT_1763234 [Mycena galopus ATCC 62051]|nr:hypothetical protein K438DRAFT_1763234 [Mycena galopus ATCC 62051]